MDDRTYDEMTKAELMELAEVREIAGRASMSKADLVAALAGTDATGGDDTGGHGLLDGVDETEDARINDAQSAPVDVPYPPGMPGPHPPRSAPEDPNARMSSLGEE